MRKGDSQKTVGSLSLPYKSQSHQGIISAKLYKWSVTQPSNFGLLSGRVIQSHGSVIVFVFLSHIMIYFDKPTSPGNKRIWQIGFIFSIM